MAAAAPDALSATPASLARTQVILRQARTPVYLLFVFGSFATAAGWLTDASAEFVP